MDFEKQILKKQAKIILPSSGDARKRLIYDGILLCISGLIITAIVLGWFVSSRKIGAELPKLEAAAAGNSSFQVFELVKTVAQSDKEYIIVSGDSYEWVEIELIDFTNIVPNQSRRYKLVMSSGNFSKLQISISTVSNSADLGRVYEIFDYICFKNTVETDEFTDISHATGANPPLTFNENAAAGNGEFIDGKLSNTVFSCQASGNNGEEFVFDLYLSYEACAYYGDIQVVGNVAPKR